MKKRFITPQIPEDKLQMDLVRWIDVKYPNALYTHCPNGGNRSLSEGIKFKLMGVKPGVPDLIFFDPIGIYIGLAIELKSGKNKTTKAQNEWLKRLDENTFKTAVHYTFEGACREIEEYYGG